MNEEKEYQELTVLSEDIKKNIRLLEQYENNAGSYFSATNEFQEKIYSINIDKHNKLSKINNKMIIEYSKRHKSYYDRKRAREFNKIN